MVAVEEHINDDEPYNDSLEAYEDMQEQITNLRYEKEELAKTIEANTKRIKILEETIKGLLEDIKGEFTEPIEEGSRLDEIIKHAKGVVNNFSSWVQGELHWVAGVSLINEEQVDIALITLSLIHI